MVAAVSLAAGCLGLAPLAKKAALAQGADPLALSVASTMTAAAIAVLPLLRPSRLPVVRATPASVWRGVFLVGAIGSGVVVLLGVVAMTETTATNRSVFQSMYPVATALCARLMLGESLRPGSYGLIALMSTGLVLMNSGPQGLVTGRAFWLLSATLPLIGIADVLAKRALEDADPRMLATGRLVFGALVLLGIAPWLEAREWRSLTGPWLWVGGAGAMMAAGMLGLYSAMARTEVSIAAAFMALAPVVTMAAEWLLLGTRFDPMQIGGLLIVAGGAVLLARRA